jgi:RNase H-like domain found in reverse transcriptase/Reverse transcriptase (RNA-dependent DNA polymerase)/Integrase zinc binding domain/Integrase core domain/Chromo (CHRromatin Organisation MOdifier) domain/Retrotransposon gag protein/Zinc knuckle
MPPRRNANDNNEDGDNSQQKCSMFMEELVDAAGVALPPSAMCPYCPFHVAFHSRKPIPPIPIPIPPAPAAHDHHHQPSMFRDVIKTLPKWRKDFNFCHQFLKRFEQVVTAGSIPISDWPRLLLLCVEDVQESEWIRMNIVVANLNWKDASDLFIKHFEIHSYNDKIQSEYHFIRQKKNESVQHYADRFSDLCSQIGIADDDSSSITKFILGLNNDLSQKFKEQIRIAETFNFIAGGKIELKSLKKVIEMAIALDFRSTASHYSGENKTGDKSDTQRKHCQFHPNATNHSWNNCRMNPKNHQSGDSKPSGSSSGDNKKNIICYKCNQAGHIAPNCPQKNSSSSSSSSSTVVKQEKSTTFASAASAPNNKPSFPSSVNAKSVTFADDEHDGDSDRSDNDQINVSKAVLPQPLREFDHTLPESIIVPKRTPIMLQTQNGLYKVLVDPGATASLIDRELAKTFNIAVDTSFNDNGPIRLGDSKHVVPREGFVELDCIAYFPGTDRTCFKFNHIFEIMNIYDAAHADYQFILGLDILKPMFKKEGAVPFQFCAKECTRRDPIVVSRVTVPESSVSEDCYLFEDSLSGDINISNVNVISATATSNVIDELKQLENEINDLGAGELPLLEIPSRPSVSTDSATEAEYERKRAELLSDPKLVSLLACNAEITGFCILPESVVEIILDPELAKKCYRRQYPIPHTLENLAHDVVMRWLATSRICLAPPGCPYNNPITIAPKKDENGKLTAIRVCLDTRMVNAALIAELWDRFQLPYIREALDILGGNSIFGEFDLSEAYLQFHLHPNSQQYTAFTWRGQQYMFVGCPFGLSPLPSIYQRVMARIFSDLNFTFPYIDNLPFGSKSFDEHLEHATLIIERLNQVNLKIKHTKYNIGHSQLKCLGHLLTKNGIGIDPEKLSAVRDWELPATGEQLMSFLGFINFIREHVRHVAELTGPLEAIKFSKTIVWNDLLIDHFNATKEAILKAPFLNFPDFSRPFHIATDASNVGVGGVLYQPTFKGEHVTATNMVNVASKKLTPCQQRYAAYKKELFGVVYCLRKFHSYVWGRNDLVIVTDHKPLTYILKSQQLSPALQQWLDVISDYKFEIVHRDGILHVLPDQLSRMFSNFYAPSASWGVSVGDSFHAVCGPLPADFIESSLPQPKVNGKFSSWVEEGSEAKMLASDNILVNNISTGTNIVNAIKKGRTIVPANSEIESDADLELQSNDDLEIDSDESNNDRELLLLAMEKRGKKVPPENERVNLIQTAHAFGHFGRDAIYKKLFFDGYWWPKMRADIEDELKKCDPCLRFNVSKSGFHPAQAIYATSPWDHVQIDNSVHLPESDKGHRVLLVIICVFTGFVVLCPCKNSEAETIARKLWKLFCLIGFPRILQSDNGPEFVNEVLRVVVKLSGINHRFISPYNPRADGKVERAVGTTIGILKKQLGVLRNHWHLFVPFIQLSFNTKIASLTNSTAFSLMFGRKLNELRDYTNDPENPPSIDFNTREWQQHQEKIISVIYPAVSDRINGSKDAMVKRLNEHRKALLRAPLPNGAVVMLRDPTASSKFDARYVGPYTVVRRARNGAYVLRDVTGDVLDRHVPIDQLKVVSKKRRTDLTENVYVVNKIVDHRSTTAGTYEYLVDWQGYKERTWEPESSFQAKKAIQDYWSSVDPTSSS